MSEKRKWTGSVLAFGVVCVFVVLVAVTARVEETIYLPTVLGNASGAVTATPTATATASATPTVQVTETPTATPGWPDIALAPGIDGFTRPVYVTGAGDGSGRLFVVEQEGIISVVRNGQRLVTPFLDIRDRVRCCGERGLLGMAFPPGPAPKGHFYVNYTTEVDGQLRTRVSRFRLATDTDVADPASEQIVLTFDQPFANHNGGQLAFGPDGFLYVGTGDGGSSGDPHNNAQNLGDIRGKMLRIDVETGSPLTYTVPITNPFVGENGVLPEIWAYGLRNPWRYSFDRETDDLYIADVGQNEWEEVDFQPAASPGGENYGWRITEGTHCFDPVPCSTEGLTLPIQEYSHDHGDHSISGGYVYRGIQFPALRGVYVYADFVSGRLWGLRRTASGWENRLLLDTNRNVSSFGEDDAGEVWLVDYGGSIHRIVPAADR